MDSLIRIPAIVESWGLIIQTKGADCDFSRHPRFMFNLGNLEFADFQHF